MTHLISISDLTHEGICELLDLAARMKERRGSYMDALKGMSLAMIFEKPSTRTRVSLEVAMTELGGHALYLNYADLQLGRSETICDTARVLSRYVHVIAARVYSHETVRELARCADIPVINALSDMEHPCQLLADLLTIRELAHRVDRGREQRLQLTDTWKCNNRHEPLGSVPCRIRAGCEGCGSC
jgi:ornithine carbamoyltransferase